MKMKRSLLLVLLIAVPVVFAACGGSDDAQNEENEEEELPELLVDFDVPEEADVDETFELKATVTYGDEKVDDADEVEFEYWEKGNEEDSTKIETNNDGDGIYTAEVSFDKDGDYEMYAHTTARGLHTMPKKSIMVGDGATN